MTNAGKTLVFLGDSLTQWFDWQRRFPAFRVLNLGIAGEPIEGLLGRRDAIRAKVRDPDFLFLMTGINNLAMEQYSIEAPFREIVRNLTTWYKKTGIVIQSILPVDLTWISNDLIQDVNRRLQGIAEEYGTAYLDVFSSFLDAQGEVRNGFVSDDGVHLTTKGYEAWAKTVEGFLSETTGCR